MARILHKALIESKSCLNLLTRDLTTVRKELMRHPWTAIGVQDGHWAVTGGQRGHWAVTGGQRGHWAPTRRRPGFQRRLQECATSNALLVGKKN
jgi:hypothetical protein